MANNQHFIDIIVNDKSKKGVDEATRNLSSLPPVVTTGIYVGTNAQQVHKEVVSVLENVKGKNAVASIGVRFQDNASPRVGRLMAMLSHLPDQLAFSATFDGGELWKGLRKMQAEGKQARDIIAGIASKQRVVKDMEREAGSGLGSVHLGEMMKSSREFMAFEKQIATFETRISNLDRSLEGMNGNMKKKLLDSSSFKDLRAYVSEMKHISASGDISKITGARMEAGVRFGKLFHSAKEEVKASSFRQQYGVDNKPQLEKAVRKYDNLRSDYNSVIGGIIRLSTTDKSADGLYKRITRAMPYLKEARAAFEEFNSKHKNNLPTNVPLYNIGHLQEVASKMRSIGTEIERNNQRLSTNGARVANKPLYQALDYYRGGLKQGMSGVSAVRNEAIIGALKQQSRELAKIETEKFDRLRAAAARYGQELQRVNAHAMQHQGMLGQIGQELVAAYSVYQLKQFLTNLVEIGGQFEYQRKAIANILGDTGRANTLFDRIKNLALKSPFSTLELDQYAKQLSAFDVEYSELFQKLTKLSDISAGTGADMSRIILAYGHVKAEGFLTGMQRRQFSNANINIVGALADKYSREENRNVSKSEIYKRISNKQVSSDDLEEVLMAMAEPGGKFYNMQEAMAGTTKAMWKNVGDSINHLYMDLEQKNRDSLKYIAEKLMSINKVAKDFVPSFAHLAAIIGVARLATIAFNGQAVTGFHKQNAALVRNRVELERTYAMMAKGNNPFRGLFGGIDVRRGLPSAHILAAANGNLTADDAMRQAYMGRLGNITAAKLQGKDGTPLLSKLQLQQIQQMNAGLKGHGVLVRAGILRWRGMTLAIRSAAIAVKGFLASMGWMLAISAVMEGLYYWWNKSTQEAEKHAENLKNAREAYENFSEVVRDFGELKIGALNEQAIINSIEDMRNKILDEAPIMRSALEGIFATDFNGHLVNSKEKIFTELQSIIKHMGQTKKYLVDKGVDMAGIVEDAINGSVKHKGTGFWGIGDFQSLYEGIASEQGELNKALLLMKSHHGEFQSEIMKMTEQFPLYGQALRQMGILTKDGVKDMGAALLEANNYPDIAEKMSIFLHKFSGEKNGYGVVLLHKYNEISTNWKSISSLNDDFTARLRDGLMKAGVSYEELGKTGKQALAEHLYAALMKAEGGNEQLTRSVMNAIPAIREYTSAWYSAANAAGAAFGGNEKSFSLVPTDISQQFQHERENRKISVPFDFENSFKTTTDHAGRIKLIRDSYKKLQEAVKEGEKRGTHLASADKDELARHKADKKNLEDIARALGIDLTEDKNKGGRGGSKVDLELKKWKRQQDALKNFVDAFEKLRDAKGEAFQSDKDILKEMKSMSEYKEVLRALAETGISASKLVDSKSLYKIIGERIRKGIPAGKNPDKEARAAELSRANEWRIDVKLKIDKNEIEKRAKEAEVMFQRKIAEWELYVEIKKLTGSDVVAQKVAGADTQVWDDNSLALMKRLGDGLRFDFSDFEKDVLTPFNKERADKHAERVKKAKNDVEREHLRSVAPKHITMEDINSAKVPLSDMEELFKGTSGQYYKMYAAIYELIQKNSNDFKRNTAESIGEVMNASQKLNKLRNNRREALGKFKRDKDGNVIDEDGYSAVQEKYRREERDLLDSVFNESSGTIEAMRNVANLAVVEIEKVKAKARELLTLIDKDKQEVYQDGKLIGYNYKLGKDGKYQQFIKTDTYNGLVAQNKMVTEKGAVLERQNDMGVSLKRVKSFVSGKAYDNPGYEQNGEQLKLEDVIGDMGTLASSAGNVAGSFKNMWAAFSDTEGLQDSAEVASEALNGIGNIAQGFAQGGVFGAAFAAVGSITSMIGTLAKAHDAKLDRAIKRSKERVDDLKYAYDQLNKSIEEGYGRQEDKTAENLENLKRQATELQLQADLERQKKKMDRKAIKEYERQYKEVQKSISDYSKNLAKSMYGIDFKSWAKQLSDAMSEAWMNGEDMALKWRQTVGDLIRQVAMDQIRMKIFEPRIEAIAKKYFDKDGSSYVGDNLERLDEESTNLEKDLRNEFDLLARHGVDNILTKISSALPETSRDQNSGNLGRLTSNITEDTGSLLSSYVNGIRSDVSIQKTIAKQQLTSLNMIVDNTRRSAEASEAIRGYLEKVTGGKDSFKMR